MSEITVLIQFNTQPTYIGFMLLEKSPHVLHRFKSSTPRVEDGDEKTKREAVNRDFIDVTEKNAAKLDLILFIQFRQRPLQTGEVSGRVLFIHRGKARARRIDSDLKARHSAA